MNFATRAAQAFDANPTLREYIEHIRVAPPTGPAVRYTEKITRGREYATVGDTWYTYRRTIEGLHGVLAGGFVVHDCTDADLSVDILAEYIHRLVNDADRQILRGGVDSI